MNACSFLSRYVDGSHVFPSLYCETFPDNALIELPTTCEGNHGVKSGVCVDHNQRITDTISQVVCIAY